METVLYLSASPKISGAERSLLTMLDALDRRSWHPIVATPLGPLAEAVLARGVQVLEMPWGLLRRPCSLRDLWRLYRRAAAGQRALTSALQVTRPAVIHANTTQAMLYAFTVREYPIIWQVRDLSRQRRLGAVLYHKATRVACISSAVEADIRTYAHDGGKKITLCPPAVDMAQFHPVAERAIPRASFGLPVDRPLIGLIAQFVPWKRHHLFLDALARLPDRPWHAILAGADLYPWSEYLPSLEARVNAPPFAGRVTRLSWQEDPAPLMAALDLLVLTSQHEPFGRVLIEAMSCGVPVIASRGGGTADIVTHEANGLLVGDDPADWAQAIARLLDDAPLRARLAAAGRQTVCDRFSLTAHRERLTALYRSVLRATASRTNDRLQVQ